MKFTKFVRLRNAVANLDMNFIRNKIAELREYLSGQGQSLEPENTAVTEGGIYYMNPRSGMATKVAMYLAEQKVTKGGLLEERASKGLLSTPEDLEMLNTYHLMKCNFLTEDERHGWKKNYRIVQRPDESFYYRLLKPKGKKSKDRAAAMTQLVNARGAGEEGLELFQEIESQKLHICGHCLMKVNSLIDADPEYVKEDFELGFFFDAGFEGGWQEYSKERGSLADIYPEDWERIAHTRMEQAQYLCEMCNLDMSHPNLRKFLHIETTDHLSRKVSYIRLRCLCLGCRADQPDGERFQRLPEFEEFLNIPDE